MTDKLTVSVLGAGIMAAGMARNLLSAGHTVRVWNRNPAKAAPLAADSAHLAGSPADAVQDADIVLTMLHDGHAVSQVVHQAAPALRPGAAWVQCSTTGLDAIPGLAELADQHRLVFYDAPVLGTRQPAETGRLPFLAAGPVNTRPLVTPVFDTVGARTRESAGGLRRDRRLDCPGRAAPPRPDAQAARRGPAALFRPGPHPYQPRPSAAAASSKPADSDPGHIVRCDEPPLLERRSALAA